MGIKGLQKFIECYCSGCFYTVSITKLIEEWKKEHNEQPIIVVDGSGFVNRLYDNQLEWVSGGQYREYFQKIDSFVEAFIKLDVRLVFFFGESPIEVKQSQSWESHFARMARTETMMEKLAQGVNPSCIALLHDTVPRYKLVPHAVLAQNYLKTISDVEVHQTIGDLNCEIARYARKNNCFAILAQDTEYIIFDGGKYYLSLLHFNRSNMSTKNYDRKEFASFLGLKPEQLAIFATLVGNEFVNRSDLEPFHESLLKEPCSAPKFYRTKKKYIKPEEIFKAVAKYVKEIPAGDEIFQYLPGIARNLRSNNHLLVDLLAVSIRSYSLSSETKPEAKDSEDPEWSKVTEKAQKLYEDHSFSSIIFSIITGKTVEIRSGFEEWRDGDLPSSVNLLHPLRQKLYGIILQDAPIGILTSLPFEVLLTNKPVRRKIEPVFPREKHHGLLTLWSEDRGDNLQQQRWQLFAHSMSTALNPTELQNLPDGLILPVAVAVYFKDCPNLKLQTWEIEAIMAMAVILTNVNFDSKNLPRYPVNVCAINIGTLYIYALSLAAVVFGCCGYPLQHNKIFNKVYWDGKLFQQKYKEANNEASLISLCDNQEENLELFNQMRKIVFN